MLEAQAGTEPLSIFRTLCLQQTYLYHLHTYLPTLGVYSHIQDCKHRASSSVILLWETVTRILKTILLPVLLVSAIRSVRIIELFVFFVSFFTLLPLIRLLPGLWEFFLEMSSVADLGLETTDAVNLSHLAKYRRFLHIT